MNSCILLYLFCYLLNVHSFIGNLFKTDELSSSYTDINCEFSFKASRLFFIENSELEKLSMQNELSTDMACLKIISDHTVYQIFIYIIVILNLSDHICNEYMSHYEIDKMVKMSCFRSTF